MEFIDYASYPTLSNTDFPPATTAFTYSPTLDQPCIPEPFALWTNTSPVGSNTYHDQPISSLDATKGLDTISPVAPSPVTQHKATWDPPLFNQLDPFPSGLPFDSNAKSTLDTSFSPISDHSRTPSLCDDVPQESPPLASPPLSPRPQLKRESTESSLKFEECPSNPPKRKRGRPRLDRSTSTSSTHAQRAQRLPHNQVERKYREGINASLERLRMTVPALCQEDDMGGLLGHPRPSKAMILQGAIEHIKTIEKERDMYRAEIERLRRELGGGGWDAVDTTGFPVDA
ncbi:hypothetical protein BU23DRAFT_253562 [Bimuria novae-zelandiae CBS 107.79]|uniref:BHLH domain-containing protein n=1 Tax=Bimuria novae-zelandiae CBS 107.79 TaxID=1447943 RepID=A0A6A5VNR7_9PLEO|nr:hypothetical protein BU23DRAFT_253562 [Bimuria novae-zelandiae CBS 107.79]